MIVRFYLPHDARGYNKLLAKCIDDIIFEFGGCTTVQGDGTWFNPNTVQVNREKVTIIETQCRGGNATTYTEWFTRLAEHVRRAGGQHTVFFQTITGAEGHSVGPTTIVPPPHRRDK